MILVTGGAGFIGSNFVIDWLAINDEPIINLDKLTYAGNPDNFSSLEGDNRHHFVKGDICDRDLINQLMAQHKPRAIVHFAAESHVDRSIHGPGEFIKTNVDGTFSLLEAARAHCAASAAAARPRRGNHAGVVSSAKRAFPRPQCARAGPCRRRLHRVSPPSHKYLSTARRVSVRRR